MLPVGQVVSHYRIVEKLGGGGMGVVYAFEVRGVQRIRYLDATRRLRTLSKLF